MKGKETLLVSGLSHMSRMFKRFAHERVCKKKKQGIIKNLWIIKKNSVKSYGGDGLNNPFSRRNIRVIGTVFLTMKMN